jgi:hypothetical protein
MAHRERTTRGWVMRPNYFVFCEGDTEVKYVEMLRSQFRCPIHIIPKKTLLNITPALVERCKATYMQSGKDKTFLMYDLDVPTMLKRLKKVPNATLLCTNPCFEIWLLLHEKDQKAPISSEMVVKELMKSSEVWKGYTKSVLTRNQQIALEKNLDTAVGRAKLLTEFQNPSTGIYKLIEMLKETIRK